LYPSDSLIRSTVKHMHLFCSRQCLKHPRVFRISAQTVPI
jgi:hypothetical protein